MSADAHHDDFMVTREADRASRGVIAIATIVLLVFVPVCTVIAIVVTRAFTTNGALSEPEPAKPELGMIEQTPIRETRRGLDEVNEQRRSLETWGWVDRRRGIARIPIERAMDVVAAEAAGKGAP
jgi:hypothetical protein